MGVLQLLSNDNFIAVNKTLAKAVGLDEAVILGELASEYNYYEKHDMLVDGLFYSTVENVEDKTTLSDYRQRKALKNLQEAGLLEVRRKGVPAKRYILLREDQIAALFENKNLKDCRTESQETEEPEPEKVQGNKNRAKKNTSNKKRAEIFGEIVQGFSEDLDLQATIWDFIEMRRQMKAPMTDRALSLLLSKLEKLSSDTKTQIAILDQSIESGWKSIYPLKDNRSGNVGPNGVRIKPESEQDHILDGIL